MEKSIIEVIKANKKAIVKKAVLIGGTIAGLVIAGVVLSKNKDEVTEAFEYAVDSVEDAIDVEIEL